MSNPETVLPPGFRFHPTDEELILHYLKNRATSLPCPVSIIAEVDIYKFDPWDLPAKAMFGDKEWYFFSPRDRKYPNGVRPNRAAASGYWKATGTDKPILRSSSGNENIGVKKALVFYKGRPPKGIKTNWIMHEYRLAEAASSSSSIHRTMKHRDSSMRLDDWVLCRIYRKSSHLPASCMADPEQEDSNVDDVYLPTLPMTSFQQSNLKMPKSSSLSELLDDADYSALSRFLSENPWDMAGPELGPLLGQTNLNQSFMTSAFNSSNGINFSLPKLSETESPASEASNCLKHQRTTAGYGEQEDALIHPSKKHSNSCTFSSFSNQFDTPQGNLLNKPFFQKQTLLNSHLGLQ